MKALVNCLALARASEQELVDSFHKIAKRHKRDFEIREACSLFAQWSSAHLKNLKRHTSRYGKAKNSDPARVGSALFHGARPGGFGLLRDLQDLLLLVHQTRTAWTALIQAAKEMKDTDMAETALHCAAETDRQMDWLCTHIKVVAPQALTVPINATQETKASLPRILRFVGTRVLIGATVLCAAGLAWRAFRLNSGFNGGPARRNNLQDTLRAKFGSRSARPTQIRQPHRTRLRNSRTSLSRI